MAGKNIFKRRDDISDMKVQYMEQLGKSRIQIMSATEARFLRNQVQNLERNLRELESESTGELHTTVQMALEKIQEFWLYDATRIEVCKRIMPIIHELNH